MAETVTAPKELSDLPANRRVQTDRVDSSTSLVELWHTVHRNGRVFLGVVGVLIAACLIYCLIAPNEYEASGEVELRSVPDSLLAGDRRESLPSGTFATGQIQLETLANVLRSEQLAWDVITQLRLYSDSGFSRSFQQKVPSFNSKNASVGAKEYLLRRFRERLTVPPGYADAIAEAVLRILADSELRGRMSGAARAWAVKHFEQQRVLQMTVQFYEELLKRSGYAARTGTKAVTG